MQKPTILVTGATGKTGQATIAQLLTMGYPVRALVHRADARSERLDKLGVEMVVGSRCDHHICSASTFSWWAAWLDPRPDTIVVVPEPWAPTACASHVNRSEMHPPAWVRLQDP